MREKTQVNSRVGYSTEYPRCAERIDFVLDVLVGTVPKNFMDQDRLEKKDNKMILWWK